MAVDPPPFLKPKWPPVRSTAAAAFLVKLRLAATGLFQRGIDRGKLGVEFGAKAIDDSDDRKVDAGRNQTVLDGCSSGLVGQKFANDLLHD